MIEHIKDLKRLKDHISSGKRVILAASSWGTNLALIYSIYFPRDISGLILSGFTDWRGINSKKIDLYNYQIDSIINFKRAVPISYMSDSILKSIMSPSRYSVSNTTKPEMMNPDFSKRFHRKSSEAYQLTFNSLPSMPDLTFFPEIQVPALIIRGNLNCGYPDWSDIISKKITGSELYTIINTCHDPWYSNPELFFSKCFDFIKLINH